jgi:hypothetical protein
METTLLKKQISNQIENLPSEKLSEIKDFISFISNKPVRHRQHNTPIKVSKKNIKSTDPLLDYIGSIDSAEFPKNIDEELYGNL